MPKQSCNWCFTINNPSKVKTCGEKDKFKDLTFDTDEKVIKFIMQYEEVNYYVFQRERGHNENTEHIQGFIQFKNRKRGTTLQNMFPPQLTALGELLIDFTENGTSAQGNPLLEANPGGAPCNVLAMLEKLGKKTAFIGKVGKDMFGEQLKTAVEEVGIDTRNLVMDEEVHTTLAFVHTYPDGDRDFSFYRNPGADMMLKKEEVDEDLIRGAKIFHFGTLSSTHEGVREATRYAIDVAKEAGCIVSFDPNLRPPLWKSLDEAKAEIEYGLSKCDILKISDNEVEFLFGTTDYDEGARLIREKYQIPLVLITLGKDGSRAYYKDLRVEVPGFVQEHTIETTGAGDTFCANSLNYILEHGMEELTEENLKELLTFANAAASLITTRKGALRVMPTREEIKNFIQNV